MNYEFYQRYYERLMKPILMKKKMPPDTAHDLMRLTLKFPEYWKTLIPQDFENDVIGIPAGFVKNGDPREIESLSYWGPALIVVGSVTEHERKRNPKPNIIRVLGGSALNSYGLNNPGIEDVADNLARLPEGICPVYLNIAGETSEEMGKCVHKIEQHNARFNVAGYVANFSCPNTDSGDSYEKDPKLCGETLDEIIKESEKPVYVKLSPCLVDEEKSREEIIRVCMEAEVSGFVLTNTLDVPDERFARGSAGLSGDVIFEDGKYNGVKFYGSLNTLKMARGIAGDNYDYWGCGGVNSRKRVQMMIDAGVSKVLVYTGIPFTYGPWTFRELSRQL